MSGIFGIVSEEDCVEDLFYGVDYHSHLGTMFGGMAAVNKKGLIKKSIHSLFSVPFRPKLEDFVNNTESRKGIGVISDYEAQPLVIDSKLGSYAIVHVGKVNNLDLLTDDVREERHGFSEVMDDGSVNPTALISNLINRGKSIPDGIEVMQNLVRGSSSVLLLTHDGIYVARDRFGRTPLFIGRKDGAMAVTFETTAFPNQGFKVERVLGPGEIGILTEKNYEQLKKPGDRLAICSFLWVYYGYPSSHYEGINVEVMRNKSGDIHGLIDDADGLEIDIAAGIPDSGTGHAIGYANAREGVSYGRPFIKYTPTWPRSFMPQEQSLRDLVAKKKLIPVPELIEGKRILFCEDSIVRGTQLKDNINLLFEDYHAREVHMRPACPPLIYSCDFLNFSRSKSEMDLAGRVAIEKVKRQDGKDYEVGEFKDESSELYKRMVEAVRDGLGLSSLRYQKLDNLVKAIGLPKEKLCTHCWDKCSGGVCSDKLYLID